MRQRLKIGKSKVYDPNTLGITFDNDLSHQKMWDNKIEETKHVQEQKKIDRMFFGIIKERMFGKILLSDKKLSNDTMRNLDRIKQLKTR